MNHLKALSTTDDSLRVSNYIVLFGGKDLSGDFFTKSTNFKSAYTDVGTMYVDFEHGLDLDGLGNNHNEVIGLVDWKTARFDENGIHVERVLNRRAAYMKFLEKMIRQGLVGTSSMAIPGSPRRSGGEIVRWPLMRDSLTVTPMEPRMIDQNTLQTAKSLLEFFPHAKSLAHLCGEEPLITTARPTDIRSFEAKLRDELGFSVREAKRLAAGGWSALAKADDDQSQELTEFFRAAAKSIKPSNP